MSVGVVVIGRNEGARLGKCIESVAATARTVVYVDSGSTDDSVPMARAKGVAVVELNMHLPFTAARARNEGFRKLRELEPNLAYVQFVDGDCELAGDWLKKAALFLSLREDVAVVCGRLRERYPERSIYNLMCDIEWDTPAGETKACGGIAMMRAASFERVNGFRADLIAGEEPELCIRLRALGWRIWRLAEEMALHDAAMTRFSQWWRRCVRGGYAFAEGAALHGRPPARHWVRESRSAWLWGLGIPLASLIAALLAGPWMLSILLVYPLQIARLALRGQRKPLDNWARAGFLVLGKFPEMLGQIKYWRNRLGNKTNTLIEYK